MDIDLDKIFEERWVEQCRIGCEWLYRYVENNVNPKVYLETGCAKLGTFFIHEHLLPSDGLSIGIDVNDSPEWYEHKSPNGSKFHFFQEDSGSLNTFEKIKNVLGKRKIDFLFIDGDHNIEPVQQDWDLYSTLVRPGGIVAFHDYDASAYHRGVREGQGAAWVCAGLQKQGYKIRLVPVGSIGVSFVRMP